MNVDLHQLRIFVAVARLGNFTRAAERLSLSQPSLSLHVRQLEQDLQVRLFDRSTRSVALTRAGDDFLPIAERLLDDFQSAVAAVTDLAARSARPGRGRGASLGGGGTPSTRHRAAARPPSRCQRVAAR
jgi:DNA-binding transcriptional LysR family regulator